MDIQDLDVIQLIEAQPGEGLAAGAKGTIVGVYPVGYLVEFDDEDGRTLAEVVLQTNQFEVIWRMPRPASVPE